MADTTTTIRLRVTGNTREISQTRRELERLAASGALGNTQVSKMNKSLQSMDRTTRKLYNRLNKLGSMLISVNKMALKLFTVGFSIGAAALASINGLFAIGRVLMKAYTGTMQILAGAIAAVGAAAVAAAAAFREYNAAVNAYQYKNSTALPNRLSESSAALRNLQTDATLAAFGIGAVNQAFAAVSKNTQFNAQSRQMLKGLADFASAGGDPAKQIAAAAEFVGLFQKKGKIDASVINAAAAIGPTFEEAFKQARKAGVTTLDGFNKMLSSGELAKMGGVEGQAGIVGDTVFARFKKGLADILTIAQDIGQSILGPLKNAMTDIVKLFEYTMFRIAPELVKFGRGSFLSGMLSFLEKISDFTVNLFRKYLPGANGVLGRFAGWWRKVVYVYDAIVAKLRSMLDLGRAVMDSFGPFVKELFGTVGRLIREVGESIRDNKDQYMELGEGLRRVVERIGDIGSFMIETFEQALPTVNRIVSALEQLVGVLLGVAGAMRSVATSIGGSGGAFMMMFSLLGLGMMAKGKAMSLRYGGRGGILNAAAGRMFGGRGAGGATSGINSQGGVGGFGYGPMMPGAAPYYAPGNRDMGYLGRMRNAYGAQRQYGPGGLRGLAGRFGAAGRAGYRQRVAATAGRPLGLGRGVGMGAGMGVGLGLGMLSGSSFIGEGARGDMAMAGTIASLAPMLGAAGPYALAGAIGYGGYQAMMKSETGGQGALGGAMMGGAIGATVGSFIPVIGTVLGGVLGAGVGAAIGFFKGQSNQRKIQAREAVNEYMNTQFKGLSEGFASRDNDQIRKDLYEMGAFANRMNDLNEQYLSGRGSGAAKFDTESQARQRGRGRGVYNLSSLVASGAMTQAEAEFFEGANTDTAAQELINQTVTTQRAVFGMLDTFDGRMNQLMKTTGLTSDEINELANKHAVNLYDQTINLSDAMREMGLAAELVSEQVTGAARDIVIKTLQGMDEAARAMEAPAMIDEITEGFYQNLVAGTATSTDASKFLLDAFGQFSLMFPDDPIKAFQELNKFFGPNGAAFLPGMQLEGQAGAVSALIGGPRNALEGQIAGEMRTSLADQIMQGTLFANVGVDRATIESQLGNMSLEQLRQVSLGLAGGALDADTIAARNIEGLGDATFQARVNAAFGGLGFDVFQLAVEDLSEVPMTMDQQLALYGEEGVAIITGMNQVIEAAFTNQPDWMKDPPDWYSKESFMAMIAAAEEDDTRTPRGSGDTTSSRLGRTLTRHNYFNSMFAGKRSITSAFRTTGLGSINSDHIMGRAYDLVGDNLGAYATMVNRSGGFAEFHGRGGNRHLHVVPGETPMGDTAAPYMGGVVTANGSSSTSNTYNFTINAAPGMDVEAVAAAVQRKIQQADRSIRERQ